MEYMIKQLKQDINQKLGFEIRRQADVRYLHQAIVLENNFKIGFNTLRRFFGFLPAAAPQLQTLEVLAKFLGHASYSEFLNIINKDQNWFHWTFINDFENFQSIDSSQIQQLIALKSHPDYVLFLSYIIKTFIRRNRIDLLKTIFSNPNIFFEINPQNKVLEKLAHAVGGLLRTLPKNRYIELEALLSETYVFKKYILDFHVDYTHFNGYYGYLNTARFAHDTHPDQRIFINLIKNYHLFLAGKSNFEPYQPEVVSPKMFPVLHGRLLGYQLLIQHFKLKQPLDTLLLQIIKTGKQYSKVLFYIEVFPALIFTKQIETLETIFKLYDKNLFVNPTWQFYTSHNVYLIAHVLVKLKRQNYKDAIYSFNQINLNVSPSNSYYHYLNLFYCIAAYQLEKHTTANSDTLFELQKHYQSLVKITGFKRFNLTLLKKY
ncbi:hypothetical protein N9J80_01900 [Flavobacteriaceae bacterium]|nr:hypothetical protein [Flavobacteriaceae bacterium]